MHNYNPPIKYSHKTKIGNWSEEWEIQQLKKKDYLKLKNLSRTQVGQKERQLMNSYQSASLSYSKDGFYRFGDHVMLFNGKTNGFLATDIYTELSKTEQNYDISTVKDIHACARSVFIIERANVNDGFKDNIIHYGQQFRIRINPLLIDKPLYLYSEPQSMTKYSKVSRLQQVTFALKNNHNTVWVFETPNPHIRFESAAEPIRADDNVLIKHQLTHQWLASDNKPYKNSFGAQFQVLVHNFLVNNKTQNLKQQKTGISTIDIPLRNQTIENLWIIVGAHDPSQEFDEKQTKKGISKGPLLQKIKFGLTAKGIFGIRFLSKILKNMDVNRKQELDVEDFRWALQAAKVFLSEEQLNLLSKEYEKSSQIIRYRKFLEQLKGKLPEKRQKEIENSYKVLKKIIGQKTTLQEISKAFDAQRHPEVYTKVKTPQQVFSEFVSSWDNIEPDYIVSFPQFLQYFSDISAIIPKDDHFQFLMVSVFHI